jgi:hypothetical protein
VLLVCHHGPASSHANAGQPVSPQSQKWRKSGIFVALCGEIRAKMCESACGATKSPLFGHRTADFAGLLKPLFKEQRTMRKIILAAAAGAAALTLSACSEKTEDAAAETADSAMADTEANAEAAGEAVDAAADDAAAAAGDAAAATTEAAAAAEAEVQDETAAEAKAD